MDAFVRLDGKESYAMKNATKSISEKIVHFSVDAKTEALVIM